MLFYQVCTCKNVLGWPLVVFQGLTHEETLNVLTDLRRGCKYRDYKMYKVNIQEVDE